MRRANLSCIIFWTDIVLSIPEWLFLHDVKSWILFGRCDASVFSFIPVVEFDTDFGLSYALYLMPHATYGM